MLTRLATYRLTVRGKRGYSLSLPASWVRDKGIPTSSPLDVFKNDAGDIVIRPAALEVKE